MDNRPRKILILVTHSDWGGVQAFLVRFAAALMKDGFEVLLASGTDVGLDMFEEAAKAGVPTRKLANMTRPLKPWKDILAVAEIRRLIDEFRPDAVHLNSSKMGVVGSIAARLSRRRPRVVYRIGGWVFNEPLPEWKRRLYVFLERATAPLKDLILVVHPDDAELAKRLGIKPKEKIAVAPNGLDLENFTANLASREEARAALGLPEGAFVYGTVSNAYAVKGLPQYLDVLQSVLKDEPTARGIVFGGGPDIKDVEEKWASLELRDRAVFAGRRRDVSRFYRAFDLYVLPSLKEGMPWALVEAMAAGVPVVVTDVGACRWMVEDREIGRAGLVVKPGAPEELAATMRKMRGDAELRTRCGENARKIVAKRFTWRLTYETNKNALLGRL